MSGYFQRLVVRAGGAVAPTSPLPPTLPSRPHAADETDPFQIVAGSEPSASPSRGAPPAAAWATLAARLADETPQRLARDGRSESAEQPTMPASVSPGHPVAAEPAERLPNQASSRAQESVAPPRPPASLARARTDGRQERAPELEQRRQDAHPEPLSPEKSVETHVIQTGTVERIMERLGKRALEPPVMADKSAPAPPPRREAPAAPPFAAKLLPPTLPGERAEAQAPDEPRLVIGRLQVDVMPSPVPAPAAIQVITRETPARQRSGGRASNLRFGLGQI